MNRLLLILLSFFSNILAFPHHWGLAGARSPTRWSCFSGKTASKVIVWPDELAPGKPRFPTPAWIQR